MGESVLKREVQNHEVTLAWLSCWLGCTYTVTSPTLQLAERQNSLKHSLGDEMITCTLLRLQEAGGIPYVQANLRVVCLEARIIDHFWRDQSALK